MSAIKIGDTIPSITVYGATPKDEINISELCKGKKVILFGLPGAFTPGCHKSHLPGYIEDHSLFVAKGVDLIACISVNDPFVMTAWGENTGATGKVKMLADTCGAFTKAIGMDFDATALLGNMRSKRYSMVIDDGYVTYLSVEPDGTGLCTSLSNAILKNL